MISFIKKLVYAAKELDKKDFYKEANTITRIIKKIIISQSFGTYPWQDGDVVGGADHMNWLETANPNAAAMVKQVIEDSKGKTIVKPISVEGKSTKLVVPIKMTAGQVHSATYSQAEIDRREKNRNRIKYMRFTPVDAEADEAEQFIQSGRPYELQNNETKRRFYVPSYLIQDDEKYFKAYDKSLFEIIVKFIKTNDFSEIDNINQQKIGEGKKPIVKNDRAFFYNALIRSEMNNTINSEVLLKSPAFKTLVDYALRKLSRDQFGAGATEKILDPETGDYITKRKPPIFQIIPGGGERFEQKIKELLDS